VAQDGKKIVRNFSIALLISLSMTSLSNGNLVRGQSDLSDTNGVLSQQTRNSIYNIIRMDEGVHFRKICRDTGKKMGVVQYHLSVLEKEGFIRSVKDGRYKCFFTKRRNCVDALPVDELPYELRVLRESIITAIKRKTPKLIIGALMECETISHQELAKICDVTPQAITFHAQKLENSGIIVSFREGRQKFYNLSENVIKILNFLK
jgi:predicted transcriptional regulator